MVGNSFVDTTPGAGPCRTSAAVSEKTNRQQATMPMWMFCYGSGVVRSAKVTEVSQTGEPLVVQRRPDDHWLDCRTQAARRVQWQSVYVTGAQLVDLRVQGQGNVAAVLVLGFRSDPSTFGVAARVTGPKRIASLSAPHVHAFSIRSSQHLVSQMSLSMGSDSETGRDICRLNAIP